MNHKHFSEIPSTQEYLKALEDIGNQDILVTCDHQTSGQGQYGRVWEQYQSGVCFSFSFYPSDIITLTALEVGVLICHFFKAKYNQDLYLKWPNDIYTKEGKKCGGILINNTAHSKQLIVGIGLNLHPENYSSEHRNPASSVFTEKIISDKVQLVKEFYKYSLDHRLDFRLIKDQWNSYCLHLNKSVTLNDGQEYKGIFTGLGDQGQAKLLIENKELEFFSGSLSLEKNSSLHQ